MLSQGGGNRMYKGPRTEENLKSRKQCERGQGERESVRWAWEGKEVFLEAPKWKCQINGEFFAGQELKGDFWDEDGNCSVIWIKVVIKAMGRDDITKRCDSKLGLHFRILWDAFKNPNGWVSLKINYIKISWRGMSPESIWFLIFPMWFLRCSHIWVPPA